MTCFAWLPNWFRDSRPPASSRSGASRARFPRHRSRSATYKDSRKPDSSISRFYREQRTDPTRSAAGAATSVRPSPTDPRPSIEQIGVSWGSTEPVLHGPPAFPLSEKEERLYWWDPNQCHWSQTRVILDSKEAARARDIGWAGDYLECELPPYDGIRLVGNSQSQTDHHQISQRNIHRREICRACGLLRDSPKRETPRNTAPAEVQRPARVAVESLEQPPPRSARRAPRPPGKSSSSSAHPEEEIIADAEEVLGGSDGETLNISKRQLRDLLWLIKGHSSDQAEFPALSEHQGRASEASSRQVVELAAASASAPSSIAEADDIFATPVRIVVDLFDTLMFENRDGPYIPHAHVGPLRQILTANALVDICSNVGFRTYEKYHDEGGTVQIGILTVKTFLQQERIPTTRDTARRRGSVSGPFFVNRRSGRPTFGPDEPNFDVNDTGGKDQFCRDNQAPIIIDDNAGIATSCAFIGVTSLLVSSARKQHKKGGITVYAGLPAALHHAYRLLRNGDSRRRLIWEAGHLRKPHNTARSRFNFGDASEAPDNITAADFAPKW